MRSLTLLSGSYFDLNRDEYFYYFTCSSGIVITNLRFEEELLVSIDNITDTYTDPKEGFLHISTSGNGIYRFSKNQQYLPDPIIHLSLFKQEPELSSNIVNSIYSKHNRLVSVGTISGVTFIDRNTSYKSQMSENVVKTIITESGIFYSTADSLYYKSYPITDSWIEDYSWDLSSSPSISGVILDFDVLETDLIALLTTEVGYIIKENKVNLSNSTVYNISSYINGFDKITFDDSFNYEGIYGSVLLTGISGVGVLDVHSLSFIDNVTPDQLGLNYVESIINI